jgi:hypothetical protein
VYFTYDNRLEYESRKREISVILGISE